MILQAQEKSNPNRQWKSEIGLNVTNVLNEVLGNNSGNAPLQYTILYKYFLSEKTAIRSGFGINLFQNSSDNFIQGFRTNKSTRLDFRLGLEWRKPIAEKLMFFIGLDGIAAYDNSETDFFDFQGKITTERLRLQFGGGPVLGFQFNISDRLSVSTESFIYYVYSDINNQVSVNGVPDSESNDKEVRLQHILPSFLYFNLRL